MTDVLLKCVKEGGKLRVKIISPGYNPRANCQFPRDLRLENRIFSVPASNILVANTRGRFFYRVSKYNIQIIGDDETIRQNMQVQVDRVYEIPECCVCMDGESTMVFVPCGHLCVCAECANALRLDYNRRCPMCRTSTSHIINKNDLS